MTPQTLPSWPDAAPTLIAIAAGRAPADTVIRGGKVVLVHTREVLEWQVAIAQGRFAYVGPDAGHCIGPDTEIIEAEGRYVIPGLCDAHM
ncbi:MAG: adenine deaminase, partial [Jannaschia helgolandensis]